MAGLVSDNTDFIAKPKMRRILYNDQKDSPTRRHNNCNVCTNNSFRVMKNLREKSIISLSFLEILISLSQHLVEQLDKKLTKDIGHLKNTSLIFIEHVT